MTQGLAPETARLDDVPAGHQRRSLSSSGITLHPERPAGDATRRRVSSYFDYPTGDGAENDLTFLADRGEADWAVVLDHTETRRFSAGDVVIRAGDDDRALYLLTAGSLAVASGAAFRTIDAPSVVGEVAFLDGGRRSLTLVATTEGELRRLSLDAFEALAGRHPELARAMLFDLGRIVSLRLRFLTELIEDGVS